MTEIFIAFLVGALLGYWSRPKNPELEEQKAIYEKRIIECVTDIVYYKQLCQWHVEQRKKHDQETKGSGV